MQLENHEILKRHEDEEALRKLYQQLIEGWNNGSGDELAAVYTEDADLIGHDGTQLKGRREIASFHQALFDRALNGSRMVGKVRRVRFLTSDIAIMHAIRGTVLSGQSDIEPKRNSILTMIAERSGGEWLLAASQNTRAIYQGRPEAADELTRQLRQILLQEHRQFL